MHKIVVIEDEKSVRLNIIKILEYEGFEVFGAEDGDVGVKLVHEKKPDLILCDIMMPVLDGYDVQNEIAQDPTTRTIPLIFLTAKAERNDMRLAMTLGADDYLTKPFTRDELLETVLSRLDKQAIVKEKFKEQLQQIRGNITSSLPRELFIPLNNIRSFLEALQQSEVDFLPAAMKTQLTESYQSTLSLERLLQNFLLYALLEVTAQDPKQIAAFRGDCVTDSVSVIQDIAALKATDFERESDLQVNLQSCDLQILEANLAKIVEELLDNAFKFSEPGSTVCVESVVEAEKFKLRISDQGQGLSSEDIARFGSNIRFSQSIKEEGTGLGLAIAKRLTEIQGGVLELERSLSNQTLVQVTLPILSLSQCQ